MDEIAQTLLELPEGTRLNVFFPLQTPAPAKPAAKGKKKEALPEPMKERLFELRKRGFNRLYQDGKIFEFSTPESLLEINFAQPVYALVDRTGGFARRTGPHCRCYRNRLSRSR